MAEHSAAADPCPTLRDLMVRERTARQLRDLAVPHEPVPAPVELREFQEAVAAWTAADAAVDAHRAACPICRARAAAG